VTGGERVPPALVVGLRVTTLGVTRLLAERGIPVRVHAPPGSLVRSSRSFRAAPAPSDAHEALADYLDELAFARAVLFPCSDDLALAAASLPDGLAERFPTLLSSTDALRTVIDKGRFLDHLRAHDVPHPETRAVDRVEELDRLSDAEIQGSFIKPRDSQAFQRRFGVKAFMPDDRADFRARLSLALGEGFGLLVQRYVPGPPSNHYFVDGFADDEGRIVCSLVRRRLRMYPRYFGNSSYMVTVPPDEVEPAIRSLARLVETIPLRGMFSAEFKRDEGDGVFRILEINARPWWYIEFAARAGMDVAAMSYEAALGRPVEDPGPYEVGRRLVYPYYDYSACLEIEGSRTGALRRMARDWWGADQPVFRLSDPLPAVVQGCCRMPGALRRRIAPGGRGGAAGGRDAAPGGEGGAGGGGRGV